MRRLLMAAGLLGAVSAAAVAQTATTQDVNITASVAKFCTVAWTSGGGGTSSPSVLTANIPVNATGVVTTSPINFTVNNAVCNTAANVVATSLSGGVKSGGTSAATGFTNIIDYTGVATLGSAVSTINTATVGTASSSEAGNTASTGGAVSGSLSISITPAQPSLPLMAATDYADTLRITITPQ